MASKSVHAAAIARSICSTEWGLGRSSGVTTGARAVSQSPMSQSAWSLSASVAFAQTWAGALPSLSPYRPRRSFVTTPERANIRERRDDVLYLRVEKAKIAASS